MRYCNDGRVPQRKRGKKWIGERASQCQRYRPANKLKLTFHRQVWAMKVGAGSENWTLFGLRCFCHWHIDRQPTNQEFPFHWNDNSKHNKTSTVILFLLSTPISPPFSPLICIILLLRSLRVALRKEDDHLRSSPTSQCLKLIYNHKLQARGFTDSFWHPFPVKFLGKSCVRERENNVCHHHIISMVSFLLSATKALQ